MTKILIIEDDVRLVSMLKDYLVGNNFDVISATHPDEGLKSFRSEKPDFIILDVMMPGMDGFEVCKIIRKEKATPILMLTARGEITDRVVGLELGADDYLPKPFEPRELLARINSILRRSDGNQDNTEIKFDGITINRETRITELDGQPLDLTSMEFNVLDMFASKPGKAFTRDEILNHLQGTNADIFSRSIDILVSRLRQKLAKASGESQLKDRFIKTIWGTGYVFVAERI